MSESNVLRRILAMANMSRRVTSSGRTNELEQVLSFLTSGSPVPPAELRGQIAFDEATKSVAVGQNRLQAAEVYEDDVSSLSDVRQVAVHFQRLGGTSVSPGPTITLLSNRSFAENLSAIVARAEPPRRFLTDFAQLKILPVEQLTTKVRDHTETENTSLRLPQPNFIQTLMQGSALPTDIHQHIAAWHEAGQQGSLANWLGLSEEEFQFWQRHPADGIRAVAAARKNRTPLAQESARLFDGLAVAARGADREHDELAEWLRKRRTEKTDS